MIVLTNTTAQTLAPGEAVVWDEVILHSGCGECHRRNTAAVKLRATGAYAVSYGANIGAVAPGAAQLSIQLGGTTLPETTAISTTAAAGDLNNISRGTKVKNCCGDYDRITLVNTGTTDITVGANSVLSIGRVS